ncbi:SDR family NAD(P)-dependent oxidoreductase [Galbitalea sp. SE-J8]|uniref:SDR family NAD(P)-dependent oxidoreductase n=1 Tax=Galbitalea sp. SE-J8 TaxID=3054952 RepID=UPI00259CF0BE|nr:SDR family NAD(P)-dependent oxidoreductase [Galbitalea sp. SE-J8]MDM4764062.1 SDR family NAD(P)-dependent oxidoreductase [Galbitalea sp. SE-J8]
MSRRLEGRRAIVTGGARGIGRSIVERFVADGAQVAILDLLESEGRETAEAVGARFFRADVRDAAQTRATLTAAIGALGGVDILVNNAGILRFSPLLSMSLEEWDETFAINLRPMLVTTQEVARAMIEAGRGGKIVNLASMAGKAGGEGQGHYAASKAAVIALTRVTAIELGAHGITANALCPGYVLTEMGAATRTAEDVAEWSSYSPLGRLGVPEDVAGVAAFLASSDGDYLTGQAINVTGGMIMH